MPELLSVQTTFFTIWEYPMSYLEFFGTILNVLCVWLVTRRSIWNWPIGIVAVVLFGFLFYQIQLYSDLLEQVYYLVTGFWGWWLWLKASRAEAKDEPPPVARNEARTNAALGGGIVAATVALGWLTARLHLFFPVLFPVPASFPYLDAFTTAMSFFAQLLMAYRRIENWVLWIIVDVISVGLYYQKGVRFVALLYFVFLCLAVKGLFDWKKAMEKPA